MNPIEYKGLIIGKIKSGKSILIQDTTNGYMRYIGIKNKFYSVKDYQKLGDEYLAYKKAKGY